MSALSLARSLSAAGAVGLSLITVGDLASNPAYGQHRGGHAGGGFGGGSGGGFRGVGGRSPFGSPGAHPTTSFGAAHPAMQTAPAYRAAQAVSPYQNYHGAGARATVSPSLGHPQTFTGAAQHALTPTHHGAFAHPGGTVAAAGQNSGSRAVHNVFRPPNTSPARRD
jgi:hypothetical protein